MAILEEIDDEAEQKKITKRKAVPAGSSKVGAGAQPTPNGMGLTRGFLKAKPQPEKNFKEEHGDAEKIQSSNASLVSDSPSKPTVENAAKPDSGNPSKAAFETTADQKADEGGHGAESAKSMPSKAFAKGFLHSPLKAASQAGRSGDLKPEADSQPPPEKHGRSAEGFARGFLNPKQRAPVESTVGAVPSVRTGNAEISGRDSADASRHVDGNGGGGRGEQMEEDAAASEENADIALLNVIVPESSVPAGETLSHGGAPQQADVEDTWSVETQISDRSEMPEEAASISQGGRGAVTDEKYGSLEQGQDRGVGAEVQSGEVTNLEGDRGREMGFAAGVLGDAGHESGSNGVDQSHGENEGSADGIGGEDGTNEKGRVLKGDGGSGGGNDGGESIGKRQEERDMEEKGVSQLGEGLEGVKLAKAGKEKGTKKEEGKAKKSGEETEKGEKAFESEGLEKPAEEHGAEADGIGQRKDNGQGEKCQDANGAVEGVSERVKGEDAKGASAVQQGESNSKKEGEAGDEETGENEEEEDEFHDACEDEEQQRKQALARAEQARTRGNELYATASYERALEVYSKALELAPPAYVTVETAPKDKESTPQNEEASQQREAENPQNEEPTPQTREEQSGESKPAAQEKAAAEGGLGSNANKGRFGKAGEGRLGSETGGQTNGEGRRGTTETRGRRRVRPPKVLDPKTGRLVVPDEESEGGSSGSGAGGVNTGDKEEGGKEAAEQRADQEAINCRAACHANRAACFVQLGLHDAAVRECSEALKLKPDYLKVIIRRAQAYDKLDKQEEALADWKTVLEKDPANRQARTEIRRLEPIVNEKREKMKEEMMGKLKELGNSLLGHFGLSVDNFKAVQDPNTGGYSINFSK